LINNLFIYYKIMDIQSNTIEPTEINGIELKIMNKLRKEYDKIKNKLLLEIIKELELDKTLKSNNE